MSYHTGPRCSRCCHYREIPQGPMTEIGGCALIRGEDRSIRAQLLDNGIVLDMHGVERPTVAVQADFYCAAFSSLPVEKWHRAVVHVSEEEAAKLPPEAFAR